MMLNTNPSPAELLLHSGDMLLLDHIVSFNTESTVAEFTPRADAWYADSAGRMPVWLGMELMAQTIAAHVGLLKQAQGQAPKQGVLLGTRRYQASQASLAPDETLQITVSVAYRDDSGLGAYDCVIHYRGATIVESTLKVYEPEDFPSFLQGEHA